MMFNPYADEKLRELDAARCDRLRQLAAVEGNISATAKARASGRFGIRLKRRDRRGPGRRPARGMG